MTARNSDFDKLDAATDTIPKVDPARVKAKMDADNQRRAADRAHEAKARRLVKKIKEDPEWGDVHLIVDAKDNPRLQAMNDVLTKQARRKVN